MADAAAGTQRKRNPVKRLTAAEKAAKAVANIDTELAKAGLAVINAANGMVRAGRREEAKACLDLWAKLIDIGAPREPNGADPSASGAPSGADPSASGAPSGT